jgi:hypothetical protein
MQSWKQRAQERVKEKGAGATIKIDVGDNCLRILPDKKDLLPDGRLRKEGIQHAPYREFRIHRDVGPDDTMCACGLNIEGKGRCWLCQVAIPNLQKSGVEAKIQKADTIRPQEQFIVNATKFSTDTAKFGSPKPWWVSTGSGRPGKQAQSLAYRVFSKMTTSSKRDFVDPNKGYNLNVERAGEGLKTRYVSVESDDEPTKVPLSILAAVVDLDTVIPVYDEAEQKRAYYGQPREEKEERLKSKPRGARRPVNGEAEEEEPEEVEVTEDADEAEAEDEGVEEVDADAEVEEGVEVEEEFEEMTEEVTEDEEAPPDDEEAPPEDEEEAPTAEDEEEAAEMDEEAEVEEEEEEAEVEEEEPPPPPRKPVKKAAPPPAKKAPVKKAPPPPAKKVAPKRK